jgi:AraC-like DNA-binding protein
LPLAAGLERRAVKRACEYLAEHYSENVSLEKLACIANLSPFHFNRVFSEQLGLPPHAFQTQLRVLRAQKLLRQGYSISSVAAETGFADQSHFTRQFKRLTIITPGQFIQNSKNVQDRPAQNC